MQQQQSAIFRRLMGYVKPFRHVGMLAMVAMVAYAAIDASFVYFIQPFIDKGIGDKDPEILKIAPFFVIGIFFLRGVANFVSSYALSWVGSNVVNSIRLQLFNHIMHLPVSFHDKNSSGDLLSKLTYNIEQVEYATSKALVVMIREGAFVLGLIAVMFFHSWQLSLVFLTVAPAVAVVIRIVSKRFRKVSRNIQTAMGHVTRNSEQMLRGHKVVLGFSGQHIENSKFAEVNKHNRQQRVKMESTRAISVSAVQIIASFALALVMYLVSMPAMINNISSGAFASLVGAMMMLLRPLKQLTNVNAELQRGMTAAASVFEILDTPVEADNGQYRADTVQGHIALNNVTFTYQGKTEPVLKGLNLTIAPGTTVALVGKSGSGKTTLSNLLPRYYLLDSGQIQLDGVDINDYQLTNLRSQFAIVSQQVVLFDDTIAANILYGCTRDVTEHELIEVMKQAHVWEFVSTLPEGMHTTVGENGVMLSGGQRQRLAIARAILKNAPILILDEATSALDTESERFIQQTLESLMKGRTAIVIAHRLSTIENADTIVVMDKGQVLEQGDHASLMAKQGAYAALHQMNFAE